MSVKTEGFRKALKAALDGPDIKDIEWSSHGHDFNVKKARITRTSSGVKIDGTDGHHLSHRLRWRPDDQIYYQCKVSKDGKVSDLEVNVKSSFEVLKEWLDNVGDLVEIIRDLSGDKADLLMAGKPMGLNPTPSSIMLLDGSWKGDATFLIANIISVGAARGIATTP